MSRENDSLTTQILKTLKQKGVSLDNSENAASADTLTLDEIILLSCSKGNETYPNVLFYLIFNPTKNQELWQSLNACRPATIIKALSAANMIKGELAGTNGLYWLMNALALAAEENLGSVKAISDLIATILDEDNTTQSITALTIIEEPVGVNGLYWLMTALNWVAKNNSENTKAISDLIIKILDKGDAVKIIMALSNERPTGTFVGITGFDWLVNTIRLIDKKNPGNVNVKAISTLIMKFFDALAKTPSNPDSCPETAKAVLFSHKSALREMLTTYLNQPEHLAPSSKNPQKTQLEEITNPTTMLGALIDHHVGNVFTDKNKPTQTRQLVNTLLTDESVEQNRAIQALENIINGMITNKASITVMQNIFKNATKSYSQEQKERLKEELQRIADSIYQYDNSTREIKRTALLSQQKEMKEKMEQNPQERMEQNPPPSYQEVVPAALNQSGLFHQPTTKPTAESKPTAKQLAEIKKFCELAAQKYKNLADKLNDDPLEQIKQWNTLLSQLEKKTLIAQTKAEVARESILDELFSQPVHTTPLPNATKTHTKENLETLRVPTTPLPNATKTHTEENPETPRKKTTLGN